MVECVAQSKRLHGMGGVALLLVFPAAVPAQETATQPHTDDIPALVSKLGDASFAVRTDATRQLCRIGPPARAAIEAASRGRDAEVALRAKALLDVFDELLFSGSRIELAASKRRIAWNESLDLHLKIRNESPFAARIPFEPPASAKSPASPLAEQAIALLDLADFLKVEGPDGAEIPFHIDALTADRALDDLVRQRAESSPDGRLAPGETLEFIARDFNRGWARYALLREGVYRIRLAYEPEWEDEEFTKAGVGAVRSEPVEVQVTAGAPVDVAGPNAPPRLTLSRDSGVLSARLINPTDMPLWVNGNIAPGGPPYAALRWLVEVKEDWRDVTVQPRSTDAVVFSRARLIEVAPGASAEIGRGDPAHLRTEAGLAPDAPLTAKVTYSNFGDVAWQRNQKDDLPDALRDPLPLRLLVSSLSSEPVRID